jgi:hypothetical protein
MKKVLVLVAFALFSLPGLARFDERHSLMREPNPFIVEPDQKTEPEGVQNDFLLIDRRTISVAPTNTATPLPELKQWDEAAHSVLEPIVLKPLPAGKRYFTDGPSVAAAPAPDPVAVQSARAHVVSFNTREAAERALANMASKYPRALKLNRETAREQVGSLLMWRGYFVGDRDELVLLCKDITSVGEWCNVR